MNSPIHLGSSQMKAAVDKRAGGDALRNKYQGKPRRSNGEGREKNGIQSIDNNDEQ